MREEEEKQTARAELAGPGLLRLIKQACSTQPSLRCFFSSGSALPLTDSEQQAGPVRGGEELDVTGDEMR